MTRSDGDGDEEDLAIRFVNTLAWRRRDPAEERMDSPEALLAWLQRNGLADAGTARTIAAAWRTQPDAARAAHQAAIRLREEIYTLFISRIHGKAPPEDALAGFNGFLTRACPALRIGWASGGLAWQPHAALTNAANLLAPVALSAAELMTGSRAGKVRQCQDDRGCGWLFVDESRAQNRRWCAMGDCGNRAKAQRHYSRMRQRDGAE
ncbi:MAG: CGNR zinc finger domain-containing protein [Rhodopila sp.]